MTDWTTGELDKIGAADELEIAARRPDGTLRRYVTIWVVRVGGDPAARRPLTMAARIAPCPAGQMQTRLGIEEVRLSRRETVG